MQYPLTK